MARARLLGLASVLCITAFFAAVEARPKTTALSLNPNVFVGYYWGSDRIGRHFYRVTANEGRYGRWEVAFRGVGYNRYRGYYPDGSLREEGEIRVSLSGLPPEPVPDTSDVKWGNYYMPDGTLGAQVRDGTGEQKLWYPNGKLRWKLVLRGYKRVRGETWLETGELLSREWYDSSGKVTRVEKRREADAEQQD